jgi:hypothetical protein
VVRSGVHTKGSERELGLSADAEFGRLLGNLATSEEVSVLFHEPLGPAWPLGQDLVHMPRRNEHNLTYGADESIWDILVE